MQINAEKAHHVGQRHPNDLSQGVIRALHKMFSDVPSLTGESLQNRYPETCPKSSLVRYPFVEGKWANMSPKEAFD